MANDCKMLKLAFKQTKAEEMVRVASTIIFNALSKLGYPSNPLSELAQAPQYGFTESACFEEVGPKFVRITDIQDGMINWDTVPYCRCEDPEKYLLSPNDILFARTGATTGKTYLVRQAPYAVFASYLIRLCPNNSVRSEYLYSFFQSNAYWSQVLDEKEGSAQPNVNGKKLLNIKVPMVDCETQILISKFLDSVRSRQDGETNPFSELPPFLSDQRRIVARIEELAARIEEARELRRRAVEEIDSLVAARITQIFSEYKVRGIRKGMLGDYVIDDCYGTSEKTTEDKSRTPVLRMGNIQNGHLDLRDLKYLDIREKDRKHLILKKGDILVNRTNSAELVGKSAVFDLEGEYSFASYLIRLRLDQETADPKLISLYINSPAGRAYMFSERKQMTGQANVNSKKLKALPICLPNIQEQRRIIAHLESMQSQLDSIKRHQAVAAAALDALLPAVLERAFRGEL